MNDFSRNLSRLRKERSLSQAELAERLHVVRQTISNWETGRSFPDLEMLTQLASFFHVDLENLIYPQEEQRAPLPGFGLVLGVMLIFFLLLWVGGIWFSQAMRRLMGGGVEESFLYPLYLGQILLAGMLTLCTCILLEELRGRR